MNTYELINQNHLSDTDRLLTEIIHRRIKHRSYDRANLYRTMLLVDEWGSAGKDIVDYIIYSDDHKLAQMSLAVPNLRQYWNSVNAINTLCSHNTNFRVLKAVVRSKYFEDYNRLNLAIKASRELLTRTLSYSIKNYSKEYTKDPIECLECLEQISSNFPHKQWAKPAINSCVKSALNACHIPQHFLQKQDNIIRFTRIWYKLYFDRADTVPQFTEGMLHLPLFLSKLYNVDINVSHQKLIDTLPVHSIASNYPNLDDDFYMALHNEVSELVKLDRAGMSGLRDLMEF